MILRSTVISRLHIEGMAIIDSLTMEFSPGFNVITGETGAGKSILIKALNFLSGGRAKTDSVRSGREQAMVCGDFSVPLGHPAIEALTERGISSEDGQIVLRRTLTAKGRSQAWINDVPVTGTSLKGLAGVLLDIFAQHENQRLMDESGHLSYLDPFLEGRECLGAVQRLGEQCWEQLGELRKSVEELGELGRNRDFLEFRLQGLEAFDPSEEDYRRSEQLANEGGDWVELRGAIQKAVDRLDIASALREAGQLLNQKPLEGELGTKLKALVERLDGVAAEVEDLHFELENLASHFDFDPSELEAAQERLFGYQEHFRKHHVRSVEELIEARRVLEEEVELWATGSLRLKKRLTTLLQLCQELEKQAASLTEKRLAAAARVQKAIEKEMKELMMPGAKLEIAFDPVSRSLPDLPLDDPALRKQWVDVADVLSGVSATGAEKCRFLLSANPGEPVLPLARIASGGELSRILLAFKKALAADADTCVLVFDEIDSGISGRVADVVGEKLRTLAQDFQVLCISHLPQVAVYADQHFLVEKKRSGSRTSSTLVALDSEESAKEIARLLSGAAVSSSSLANAKALIKKARSTKATKDRQKKRGRPEGRPQSG